MAEVDFSDREAATAWLETQSVPVVYAIASRAVLRNCSAIATAHESIQTEQLFARANIFVFRAALVLAVKASGRAVRIRKWAGGINLVKEIFGNISGNFEAYSGARHAVRAAGNGLELLVEVSNRYHAFFAVHTSATSVAGTVKRTGERQPPNTTALAAANLDASNDGIADFDKPLWFGVEVPPKVETNHQKFLERLAADSAIWGFWHDWYLGMWEGTFNDWDLASEVAQIPDDVWEDGAEAVAREIDKRRAKLELERKIANLKTALQQKTAVAPPSHRHHNNPPPDALIGRQESIGKEITLVWEQLETLEVEIAKPEPSGVTLKVIAQALWDISVRLAEYCGTLADVALKGSAKIVGETGTKAMIGYFVAETAAQNEGVRAVANAIWEFLKTLPPG